GEEVKIYTQGERVIALGKKVMPSAWDQVGEGIGFFKCGTAAAPEPVRLLERGGGEGRGFGENGEPLHRVGGRHPVPGAGVRGWPWTEADFVEALRRADLDVLPKIARLETERSA